MDWVTSADGTRIAYDLAGQGPAIVFVVGAFNLRSACAPLAGALRERHTVITYDRRGRGDSGDTAPYTVDREIEDLAAVIAGPAGGSATVFGYSSGAILALWAAARGVPVDRLALYEPPFRVGSDLPEPPEGAADRLAELIRAGRRGDAVEYFQTELVGIPKPVVAQFRRSPMWPGLEAIAHTLVYDATIGGDGTLPPELGPQVTVPTLVLSGGASPASMAAAARATAEAVVDGRHRSLPGQTHDLDPAAIVPALAGFVG